MTCEMLTVDVSSFMLTLLRVASVIWICGRRTSRVSDPKIAT